MTKPVLRTGFLLFTACCFIGVHSEGQNSVIFNIHESLPSIVSVESEVRGIFRTPGSAVRDKATGRVAIATGIKTASYRRAGAGVILDASGTIATNAHTIMNASRIIIKLHDGTLTYASILKVSPDEDLAFLKISLPTIKLRPITLSNSDNLTLNSRVFNVGASEFIKGTLCEGKVTGIGTRSTQASQDNEDIDLIQTSFDVYKGDSGGPLLDSDGNLLGIIVGAKTTAHHTSYAIPSKKIKRLYDTLIAN